MTIESEVREISTYNGTGKLVLYSVYRDGIFTHPRGEGGRFHSYGKASPMNGLPIWENPHTGKHKIPRIDYSQIAIDAKSWNELIKHVEKGNLTADHEEWFINKFPQSHEPQFLMSIKNGYATRLILWKQSFHSPLFDISFVKDSTLPTNVPNHVSDINTAQLNGFFRRWHLNGKLAAESNYKNGFLHGAGNLWSANGEIKEMAYFKLGKYHGDRIVFESVNSVLVPAKKCWTRYSYKNGVLQGTFIKWHPNGKIWLLGEYHQGRIHGLLSEYNDEGFRVFKTKYAYGKELWSRIAFGA